MPAFVAVIVWILVILLGAYAAFWILGKMGLPKPFGPIFQIVIGLVALYLIAALFFPLGIHFPR